MDHAASSLNNCFTRHEAFKGENLSRLCMDIDISLDTLDPVGNLIHIGVRNCISIGTVNHSSTH